MIIAEEVNMEKKTKILAVAGVAGLVALGMLGKGSSDTSTGTGGGGGIAPFADMLQFGGEEGSKKDASVTPVGGTGGHTFNLPAMEPITIGDGGWGEPTPTYTPKKTATVRGGTIAYEGAGKGLLTGDVYTYEQIGKYRPSKWITGAGGAPEPLYGPYAPDYAPAKKAKKVQAPLTRKADSFETGRAGGTWLRSGATKGIKKSWAAHQEKRQFQWGFLKGAAGR